MGSNLFNLKQIKQITAHQSRNRRDKIEKRKNIEWFVPGCVFKREESDCRHFKDQPYRFGNSADSRYSIGFFEKRTYFLFRINVCDSYNRSTASMGESSFNGIGGNINSDSHQC